MGETLLKLMHERNLSGRALAQGINVSHKSVQEWLGKGARMPRDPSIIKKLAEYFGVSTHYILFGEEDPHISISLDKLLEKTELHVGLYEVSIRRVREKKQGEK